MKTFVLTNSITNNTNLILVTFVNANGSCKKANTKNGKYYICILELFNFFQTIFQNSQKRECIIQGSSLMIKRSPEAF